MSDPIERLARAAVAAIAATVPMLEAVCGQRFRPVVPVATYCSLACRRKPQEGRPHRPRPPMLPKEEG